MLYAIDAKTQQKISPEPRLKAICSYCESPVIAKCGNINIWHWAHKSLKDCDA
jgi:competence protein CoiA